LPDRLYFLLDFALTFLLQLGVGLLFIADLFFKTDDFVFSYRLAGILVHNQKVLLHRTYNEIGYAFPGGHAAYPETNEQTLMREFKEEISANVRIKDLKWVGEIFFPFQGKPCHQICLFYLVELEDESQIPLEGSFLGNESFGDKAFVFEFSWIPLNKLDTIILYPPIAKQLLHNLEGGVEHFIYREENA